MAGGAHGAPISARAHLRRRGSARTPSASRSGTSSEARLELDSRAIAPPRLSKNAYVESKLDMTASTSIYSSSSDTEDGEGLYSYVDKRCPSAMR